MCEDISNLLDRLIADDKWKHLLREEDITEITDSQVRIDDVSIPASLLTDSWLQPNFTVKRK